MQVRSESSQNLVMFITPELVSGLSAVQECIDNYYISQDLKQYRPQRRPITRSQLRGMNQSD